MADDGMLEGHTDGVEFPVLHAVVEDSVESFLVTEYDGGRFESLTEGSRFAGEIYVRLLYDEGCFYYVGICDREGNTHAYLLDGTNGRVLAEKD